MSESLRSTLEGIAVFSVDRDLVEVGVSAAVLTNRALAVTAAILVAIEAFKIIRDVLKARIDPRGNAIGWLMVALGVLGGGTTFLITGEGRILARGWYTELGALWIWTMLAWALVWMAARQSERPHYIIGSAITFSLAGVALTMLEGARIGVL